MNLNEKQTDIKEKIFKLAEIFGIDPSWAMGVAMVESSMGLHQKSPTGCRGVFQMSGIAMKDLLYEMEHYDDDLIDIACGILFLRLLLKRWGTQEEATKHYCDPNDRDFYMDRTKRFQNEFKELLKTNIDALVDQENVENDEDSAIEEAKKDIAKRI